MEKDGAFLDLVIIRLPHLKARERVELCRKIECEADLNGSNICRILAEASQNGVLNMDFDNSAIDAARRQAEKDKIILKRHNINYVSITTPEYPPVLREIFDPPPVIFYRGCLPNPEKPLLAVVGTRTPSSRALYWAYDFCKKAGEAGISVVSGLAFGIDSMAHKGNVDGGGKTFAVLASSCDEVTPLSNQNLASRILNYGGALISEYPPETKARKWQFPQRNRLISGLCRSLLVVEAGKKSGALISADFALEQGRDLWVAGGEGGEDGIVKGCKVFGEGCRKLKFDGAKAITSVRDVINEWGL